MGFLRRKKTPEEAREAGKAFARRHKEAKTSDEHANIRREWLQYQEDTEDIEERRIAGQANWEEMHRRDDQ